MCNNIKIDNFFNLSLDLNLIINLNGGILKTNNQWKEIFGYSDIELNNLNIIHIIHSKDKKALIKAKLDLIKNNQISNVKLRFINKEEEILWININAYIDKNGIIYSSGRDITKEKNQEKTLETLEEITGVGVWDFDLEQKIPYWSKKVHEIHGTNYKTYKPDLNQALSFYKKESLPILMDALNKMEKTGQSYDIKLPFITTKGQEILVNVKGFCEKDGDKVIRNYGTFENITEKNKIRIKTQQVNETNKLALKTSNTAVWVLNIDTGELVWDDKMFEIYEKEKSSFKGKIEDWINCLHEDSVEKATNDYVEASKTLSEFRSEFRVKTKSGKEKIISAIANFFYDKQTNTTSVIGVNWDRTEYIIAQEKLIKEKKKAELADIAKSNFLANMSHEIRTPMNGILGSLQLLENKIVDYKDKEIMKHALSSTKNLTTIINDILDFSKINANKLELEEINTDIKELVNALVETHKASIKDKDIELILNYKEDLFDFWICDPTRISQILNNLLSNAIKFTNKGRVQLDVSKKENYLHFCVQDTGIGMKQETIERLCKPFSQADNSTSRKYGGTGLGLSISKRLCELMNGSLCIQSEENIGSNFCINIPLKEGEVEVKKEIKEEDLDLSDKFILIAEDNLINQVIIREILNKTNAKMLITENGKDLLKVYNRKKPDLILSDIQMPVMDGEEACIEIRKVDKETPIIAFTANVLSEDVKKYKENGFNDVAEKPLVVEKLMEMLKKYLK